LGKAREVCRLLAGGACGRRALKGICQRGLNFASSGSRKTRGQISWPQRNATLGAGSLLRRTYLLYFSQPAADRSVLQAVRKRPIRSIVEIGVGPLSRTQRILEVAKWKAGSDALRYTGIDLFDARPGGQPPLSLKQVFATLQKPYTRVQLVPGTPEMALRRVANSLADTDLLLIDGSHDAESLASVWSWIPRMLNPQSLIFWQQTSGTAQRTHWQSLSIAEIQQFAATRGKVARRAA